MPDEQLVLMYAYLDIKAEMQREADNGIGERARQTEASRQSIEQQAWADRDLRKAVTCG